MELQGGLIILPENRRPPHSSVSPYYIKKKKSNKQKTNLAALSWAAACVAYQRENLTLLFFQWWHPSTQLHACRLHSHISTFLPRASRTHLCCENELTDDVCCVLTPIGKPHDLCDSFRTNPIICEERWQRLN